MKSRLRLVDTDSDGYPETLPIARVLPLTTLSNSSYATLYAVGYASEGGYGAGRYSEECELPQSYYWAYWLRRSYSFISKALNVSETPELVL